MADESTIQEYSAAWWFQELEREGKRGGNHWRKRAKGVVDKYRDERKEATKEHAKRFNILYANVETLKPATSARTPIPAVARRFMGDDEPTRIAGEIIQKCLSFTMDDEDFDREKNKARDDGLIAGRAVLWVEYKSKIVRRTPKLAPAVGPLPPMGMPVAPPAMPMGPGPVAAGGASPMALMAGMAPEGIAPPSPTGGAAAPFGAGGLPATPTMPGNSPSGLPTAMASDVPRETMPAPGLPTAESALPGLGAPQYMLDGRPVEPDGFDDDGNPYVDEVVEENVCARHVLWRDFRHTPVNDWSKVWWVAKAEYPDKYEAEKTFGKEKADKLSYTNADEEASDKENEQHREPGRGLVWRIWCKRTKKIYAIAEGVRDEVLKEEPWPYEPEHGLPCSEPWRPVGTTDKWEPIPEYCIYQDQADEIDSYTARIAKLTEAIKARGAAPKVIAAALNDANSKAEGEVGPVEDFESVAENGGFGKAITWVPVEQFAKVIEVLSKRRAESVQELYQLTGISDLMRQSTSPSETATAQQLKGNFGQMRLQPRQMPFEMFIRDTLRIMAEVMAEKFSRRTIERMTGVTLMAPGDPQATELGEQVMQILRDDDTRAYRIDIETDSMILPDEQAEKAAVTEFVGSITKYLEGAVQIGGADPAMVPLLMQMLKAACRRFKLGRELEDVVDKTVEEHKKLAEQRASQPPPPSPEIIEAQAKAQAIAAEQKRKADEVAAKAQAEAEARQAQAAADAAQREQDALNAEAERQQKLIEARGRADAERIKAEQDALQAAEDRRMAAEKHEADLAKQRAELALADAESRRKDDENIRKGDDHSAKMEERQMKTQAHSVDMEAKGAQRDSAQKMAEAVGQLLDAVKEMKKPRKVTKTGNGAWEIN